LEQKLAAALSEYFAEPVRLDFQAAGPSTTPAPESGELTPARREALAAEERQRAAEQAIESDPAVRAMREVFGATIKPGSVKPLT
jgi:DNA polymerase-3 subunit gamma/tau